MLEINDMPAFPNVSTKAMELVSTLTRKGFQFTVCTGLHPNDSMRDYRFVKRDSMGNTIAARTLHVRLNGYHNVTAV